MAKIIRKYWWLVVLQFGVLAAAGIFMGYRMLSRSDSALAQPLPPSTQPLDVLSYSRVQALRERLALTNMDLAAMGCSQADAQGVINALVSWYAGQAAAWSSAESALDAAQESYRQTLEQVNLGPQSGELDSQLASRKTALDGALLAWNQFQDGAGAVVTSLLSSGQNAVWAKAKSNVGRLGRYRYASGISGENLDRLRRAIARYGESSSQVAALEQSLLAAQSSDLTAARLSIHENIAAVVAGDHAALPQPEELRPRPTVTP